MLTYDHPDCKIIFNKILFVAIICVFYDGYNDSCYWIVYNHVKYKKINCKNIF